MTQEKLAAELGITFQQVQKYEKGTNRVGASRLQALASILGVPIAFFFDGAPETGVTRSGLSAGDAPDHLTALLSTSVGLALVKAFSKIPDRAVRRRIVQLVEALVADARRGGGGK